MAFPQKFFRIAYIIIFLLSMAGFVFAQRGLEVDYPEIGGIKPTVTTISLPDYVKYIFNISIALAGLIAFSVLVYAGFRYLTSAGNLTAIQDAKERIGAAVLGLLVLLGSYLILTTVNPQLTFFDLPGLKGIGNFPLSELKPADPNTLRALEIPLGGLIKEALKSDIFNGIIGLSDKIKTNSQEIKKIAGDLKGLTDSCSCGNTSSNVNSCNYGEACSAIECLGDPCPSRASMENKKEELLAKTDELKPLLENIKKLTDTLRKNLQNLEAAEDAIKNCSGQGRTLMSSTDFENYQKRLKDAKEIERVEIDRGSWPKFGAANYFLVFYCVEEPLGAAIEKIGEISLPAPTEIFNEDIGNSKSFCRAEIPVGETVDETENLLGQIAREAQLIIDNSEKIIIAGQGLSGLAGQCQGREACSTGCNQYLFENPDFCEEWSFCPEGEESCQAKCLKWVPVPPTPACDVLPCFSPSPLCPNSDIAGQSSLIETAYLAIESSGAALKDLIAKKEKGKTQIEKILNQLAISSEGVDNCYNSAEKLKRALAGEKELIKELVPCKFIKELAESQIYFYNEKSGEEIKDCYGQEPGKEDRLDNYFCCQTETPGP